MNEGDVVCMASPPKLVTVATSLASRLQQGVIYSWNHCHILANFS